MRALYDQLEQHLERKEMQLQKALIKCSDKVYIELTIGDGELLE